MRKASPSVRASGSCAPVRMTWATPLPKVLEPMTMPPFLSFIAREKISAEEAVPPLVRTMVG